MSQSDTEDTNRDRATKLLEDAYGLETPTDNVRYYRQFADIYDQQYAEQLGYIYPHMLADVFQQTAQAENTPILDIGCGTGLVAQALSEVGFNNQQIDGVDISGEMLKAADEKNLYNALFKADLTQGTKEITGQYGAIVSAGTFTFGHLGPDVLNDLISLGTAGTLYCIGVNSAYFKEQGFSSALHAMQQRGLITKPETHVKNIYVPKAGNSHANDTATVLVYHQQ